MMFLVVVMFRHPSRIFGLLLDTVHRLEYTNTIQRRSVLFCL
jgi:hypothetical protein